MGIVGHGFVTTLLVAKEAETKQRGKKIESCWAMTVL